MWLQMDMPGIEHFVGHGLLKLPQAARFRGLSADMASSLGIFDLCFDEAINFMLLGRVVPCHGDANWLDACGQFHACLQLVLHFILARKDGQALELCHKTWHHGLLAVDFGKHLACVDSIDDGAQEGEDIGEGEPSDLCPNQFHLPVVAPLDHSAEKLWRFCAERAQDQEVRAGGKDDSEPCNQQNAGPCNDCSLIAEESHGAWACNVGRHHISAERIKPPFIGLQPHTFSALQTVLDTLRVHTILVPH
mmetsp:Transcript_83193/g.146959  ORF Transcript_83193/g.146959 Transcript_83193/m.146959 type:complete len:249 (-) Transcript_83193:666-1412(-)